MKRISVIILCLMSWAARAGEPVILTISGNIEKDGHHYEQVEYTLSQLQALPQKEMAILHPWSRQFHTYKGPDLSALLQTLFSGERIKTIYLQALNGFSVAANWQELAPYHPILAWSEDEKVMSRRGKGPLWLMLPYDTLSELQQAEFLHYMTWQLSHITVRTEPL